MKMTSEYCYLRGERIDSAAVSALFDQAERRQDNYLYEFTSFLQTWYDGDPIIRLSTSGSTGAPKIIEATKDAMRASARRTCLFFDLQAQSRVLLSLPMRYVAARMMVVRALVAHLDLYLVAPCSSPLSFCPRELSFDFAPFVPLQVQAMLSDRDVHDQLKRIRTVLLGGVAPDKSLEAELEKEPNGYYVGYGMTETLSHIAVRRIKPGGSDYYRPLPGIVVRQDADGCAIIETAGGDAPLLTNDRIELRPLDGAFRFLGRRDNVINSGGVKLQPEEIERILSEYIGPNLCVVGLPDERLGQRIVLVAEEEVALQDLPNDCLSRLGRYARPTEAFCLSIPRTETGKPDRIRLAQTLVSLRSVGYDKKP